MVEATDHVVALILVETIPPWHTPIGYPIPRIYQRDNGEIACGGYVEGGEDGSPALRLPAKARPGGWVITLTIGGQIFTQRVLIDDDGITVRLWRPVPV